MDGDRRVSTLGSPDQWARCSHDGTTLDPEGGIELSWADASAPGSGVPPDRPAGLAFDRWGGGYRSRPRRGQIEYIPSTEAGRQSVPALAAPGPWSFPLGLAIDADQQLFVAEAAAGRVAVIDLGADRLLRRIGLRTSSAPRCRPVDVASNHLTTWVLLERPTTIVGLRGRLGPYPGPPVLGAPCGFRPSRLIASADHLLLVWRARHDSMACITAVDGELLLQVDGATDAELADDLLIVARRPGQTFRRFRHAQDAWVELVPVAAPGYNGDGIAKAGDGRIAYTRDDGVGWVAPAAASATSTTVRYRRSGRVTTYRLDSGAYRTRWGRMFVDACVPPGTSLRVGCLTSDEDDVDRPIRWNPPENYPVVIRRPDLTASLPSSQAIEENPDGVYLHRRANGREWPWAQIPVDDRFETYEAPVEAPPGRYLWLVIHLVGGTTRSPRVRELRVERPGHQLLTHLPRAWSRNEDDAAFLHRFLAPAEGLLHELDERAANRDVLLSPRAAPQEALAWLAGLIGLAFDHRWPVTARRTLLAEAYRLLRGRGTLRTMRRMLEIYLGFAVEIVEQWQLRGLGGILLGGRQPRSPAAPRGNEPAIPALGYSSPVGGTLGSTLVSGASTKSAFETNAHRFTVLVPGRLTGDQPQVMTRIIDLNRPAHTVFAICELGHHSALGRRMHIGLTTVLDSYAPCDPPETHDALVTP